MEVELTTVRTKKLPKGAIPELEKEMLKRLDNHYENCSLSIRRAGSDGLRFFGGQGRQKENRDYPPETWASADDWFY